VVEAAQPLRPAELAARADELAARLRPELLELEAPVLVQPASRRAAGQSLAARVPASAQQQMPEAPASPPEAQL
jgi:hypothetical protein